MARYATYIRAPTDTQETAHQSTAIDNAAPRTPNLGGSASTTDVTEALEQRVE